MSNYSRQNEYRRRKLYIKKVKNKDYKHLYGYDGVRKVHHLSKKESRAPGKI